MATGAKKKPIHDVEVIDKDNRPLKNNSKDDVVIENPDKGLMEADAFRDFDLKSEYWEKNVRLKNPTPEQMGQPVHTQVKIYHDHGVDTVDPKNLKQIIKETKGIKQVVVEKISVEEATRISLLFKPKEATGSLLEDQAEGFGISPNKSLTEKSQPVEQIEEPESAHFSLQDLETYINSPNLDPAREKEVIFEDEELDDLGEEGELNFENIESPKEEITEEVFEEPKSKKVKGGLNLKLKNERIPKGTGSINEESDTNEKKVSYSRQTLTRRKGNTHNGHYYRAKDHMELFKVGSSYMKDFKSGLKSFSFASVNMKEEREKTVFGVSTYFNYHAEVSICIITTEFVKSFYEEFLGEVEEKENQVFDEDLFYNIRIGNGFDILEFNQLKKIERKIREYDFEYFLDDLLDSYDLILWDLPELEILDGNKELYFPIVRTLDNVSFVVGENYTKVRNLNEMINYFKRYQIVIKGLLFSPELTRKGGQK